MTIHDSGTSQNPVFADDEVDLSKASLFCTSAVGRFIPQYFARAARRDVVTGVSLADYQILEYGPNHEQYDETWAKVTDNAKINDPKMGECFLHQNDGDLWIVPKVKEKLVLGHFFHPMSATDQMGFAGADADSLICYVDHGKKGTTVLILSPDGTVNEIWNKHVAPDDVNDEYYERRWSTP